MPTTRQSVRLLASAPVWHWEDRSLAGWPPVLDPPPPPPPPPASSTTTVMIRPMIPPPPPIARPPPGMLEKRPPAPRSSSICDVSSCASSRNLMRPLYPLGARMIARGGRGRRTAHCDVLGRRRRDRERRLRLPRRRQGLRLVLSGTRARQAPRHPHGH